MREQKIGDKMVVTKKITHNDFPIGTVITILSIDKRRYSNPLFYEIFIEEYPHPDIYYILEQLEFEEIYNSPLYRIMGEK